MDITASENFENKRSWTGIEKHLEHDPTLNHSNTFLNTNKSKLLRTLNRDVKFFDINKVVDDKFGDYINAQNQKNLDHYRYERLWNSASDFLKYNSSGKERSKSIDKLLMIKFSNEKDFQDSDLKQNSTEKSILDNMFDDYARKHPNLDEETCKLNVRTCISNGLVRYMKGFNKRNPNLIMLEGVVHMDEQGAPHVHARVLPYVPSKVSTGKPKWSINSALRAEFGKKDSRANLKAYRDKEDQELIKAVNEQIKIDLPELSNKYQFNLTRTNPSVKGLSHDEYKARKLKEDIKSQQDTLNALKQQIKDNTAVLKDQQDKISKVQQKQAERAKKLDKRENKLNDRELELDARTNKVVKREKQVSQQEQQVNERARDNADLLIMLNNQLNSIRQLRDSVKRQLDKWKKFASAVAFKTFGETRDFVVEKMLPKQSKMANDWLNKSDAHKHAEFINRNAYSFPDNLSLRDTMNPEHFFDDYNKVGKIQKSSDQAFEKQYNKQINDATQHVHDGAKRLKKQYKSVLTPEQLAKLDSLVDDINEKDDGIDY